MDDLFWLTKAQMSLISPYFPMTHWVARVDNTLRSAQRRGRCATGAGPSCALPG